MYVCQHGEPPDVLQDVHPDADVPNPLGDGTPTKEEERKSFFGGEKSGRVCDFLWCSSSFFASILISTALLMRAKSGARGKAATNTVMKPY